MTSDPLSTTDVVNPGLMPPAQILGMPERRRQSPDVSSLLTTHGKKQERSVPFKEHALTEHPSRPVTLSSGSEEDLEVLPPKRRRTRFRLLSFARQLSQQTMNMNTIINQPTQTAILPRNSGVGICTRGNLMRTIGPYMSIATDGHRRNISFSLNRTEIVSDNIFIL